MKATIITTAAMLMAASTLMASTAEKRIPTLKVGKCTITVLDSNGIKPLSGAGLLLTNTEDGKIAVSAVANKSGLCEITVTEGRYLLSINEKPVTLINAAKDGQMAWARIVLSESPMMVGGQEGVTTATYTFLGLSFSSKAAYVAAITAAVVSGAVAATAAVVLVDEIRNDDDNDNETQAAIQVFEETVRRPRPVSP